jgi:hypothetical protein
MLAAYNVYNAYIKADIQLPWTISTVQLLVGLLYAVPLWFLKVRKVMINKYIYFYE